MKRHTRTTLHRPAIAAALLALIAGAGMFFLSGKSETPPAQTPPQAATAVTTRAPQVERADAPPTVQPRPVATTASSDATPAKPDGRTPLVWEPVTTKSGKKLLGARLDNTWAVPRYATPAK